MTSEATPVASLELRHTDGQIQNFPLVAGHTLRVGRVAGNDIVLNDAKVSRFHAVFNVTETGVVVSDLSSLNGTTVNGRRVSTPTVLQSEDQVVVGDASFVVRLAASDTPPPGDFSERTQVAQLRTVVVTILVADVCGYTRISEALPARDVAMTLQRWFEIVSETVRAHGGEVNKFLGDAVMAIWHSSHREAAESARSALKAATEILCGTATQAERLQWPHQEGYPWTCRVCLNTGEALLGVFGDSGARDFTVLGDSINIAFRLETVAKTLGHPFIVSGATAALIGEDISLKSLGPTNLKGKVEPIEIFGVETAKP